jgi:hypothetical protein
MLLITCLLFNYLRDPMHASRKPFSTPVAIGVFDCACKTLFYRFNSAKARNVSFQTFATMDAKYQQ